MLARSIYRDEGGLWIWTRVELSAPCSLVEDPSVAFVSLCDAKGDTAPAANEASDRGSWRGAACRARWRSTRGGTGRPTGAGCGVRPPSGRRRSWLSRAAPRAAASPGRASGSGSPGRDSGCRRRAPRRRARRRRRGHASAPAPARPGPARPSRSPAGRDRPPAAGARSGESPRRRRRSRRARSGRPGPGEMTTLSNSSRASSGQLAASLRTTSGSRPVDLRQQLEEVVGEGVVVVDQQRAHRRRKMQTRIWVR